ncbi:MAG: exosortase W [Nitrospiria bacterium]
MSKSRFDTDAGSGIEKNKEILPNISGIRPFLKPLFLITALLCLYAPVLVDMAHLWWTRYDYSHGFLIPLISLYLVWIQKSKLKNLRIQPGIWAGFLIMISAGFLLIAGRVGGILTLSAISLVVMIAGLILLLFGRSWLKQLGFPVSYLLLMTPVLDPIVGRLQWPFQLMTAKMSVRLLQTLGFPVLLDQQYMILPHMTLEVATVCSGINMLVAIVTIGLPLSYLFLKNGWTRAALLVSAVLIGIAANWARVFLIGAGVFWGFKLLHGPLHILQGMFVAWVGYAFLFGGVWALSKLERKLSPTGIQVSAPESVPGKLQNRLTRRFDRSFWVAVSLLLVLAVYLGWRHPAPVALKEDFKSFPASIGGWVEVEKSNLNRGETLYPVPEGDQELIRTYRDAKGSEVQIYVAYFESQERGRWISNYRTRENKGMETSTRMPLGSEMATVTSGYLKKENEWYQILSWYDINGHLLENWESARWATMMNSVRKGRSNGAFVLISGKVSGPDDPGLQDTLAGFAREAAPVLRRYLPGG